MALFRRAQDPAALEAALRGIPELDLGSARFRATTLPAGARGQRVVPGVELLIAGHQAWFHAAELTRFASGKAQLVESWAGSPAELFLARGTAASQGSPAAAAMAQVEADQAGILLPHGQDMDRLGLLDAGQLSGLREWSAVLPRG